MPDPNTCKGYGLTPNTAEYDDCLNYRGVYSENYKVGGKIKNPRFKGKSKHIARDYSAGGKYSTGGMLVGPSHEEGGIPAIVDGTEPIEVEGGEFVINKKTVDAVGEDFLHKLNSTETPYHTGGFGEGELPSPSYYADGGEITDNRRNEMRRGRRAPARRMARGGRARPASRRMARGARRMAGGGGTCGGMNQPPCSGGGYRRGGRTRPITTRRLARGGRSGARRLQSGGNSGGFSGGSNSGCTMWTGEIDCANKSGCTWNYSTGMCH